MSKQRVFALVAAFAVAFASLWPLVSAARPRAPDIPVFMCTQSGVQHPEAPRDARDDFHCPLCIATADVVVPVLKLGTDHFFPQGGKKWSVPVFAVGHPLFSPRPPPSRAPPALS